MTAKKMPLARRRQVTATVLCALASGLFLWAASLLGGLSAQATLVVLVGPPAIVLLWWSVFIPQQMIRDADTRTRYRGQELAERERDDDRADVLEGEVLPR